MLCIFIFCFAYVVVVWSWMLLWLVDALNLGPRRRSIARLSVTHSLTHSPTLIARLIEHGHAFHLSNGPSQLPTHQIPTLVARSPHLPHTRTHSPPHKKTNIPLRRSSRWPRRRRWRRRWRRWRRRGRVGGGVGDGEGVGWGVEGVGVGGEVRGGGVYIGTGTDLGVEVL